MNINNEVSRKYKLEIVDNNYIVHEIVSIKYNNLEDAILFLKKSIPDDTWDIDEEI